MDKLPQEFTMHQDDFLNEVKVNPDEHSNQNKNDLENFNQFLAENTILNSKVVGLCKLILPFEINSFTTAEDSDKINFYFASLSGIIIRAVRNSDLLIYDDLSAFQINGQKKEIIDEILVNKDSDLLYLSSLDKIYQINLGNLLNKTCKAKTNCESCVTDSNCIWSFNNCHVDKDIGTSSLVKKQNCDSEEFKQILVEEKRTVILECGREPYLDSLKDSWRRTYWKKIIQQ